MRTQSQPRPTAERLGSVIKALRELMRVELAGRDIVAMLLAMIAPIAEPVVPTPPDGSGR